ncbi:6-phosphofructokinase [Anaerocolumna sp. MB42-C2]|uniref:6-phosphofructokinase n=1 Tax=Anaerocolumna sp. MB42-C2 TaxID=3070997 RepID=UPI0027E0D363|nr:6-phosphofructokinase [Anaerocolumna sp. MB42-C2]WMJ85333.1 6-phosphofructokinase [Anaerocolumna sp. MB42-C2]
MIGNVLVGQSGGPTAVINSSLAGVYKTAKDQGAKKVYGMLYGIQGLLEEKYLDLDEHIHSDLEIELLKRTPSSYLGSCRYKLPDFKEASETYEKIFDILYKLDIQYFFYIGGNDSMDTIKKLSDYAYTIQSNIRFIGVPKTIDNDLEITDHTPGYGSAAKFIAATTKEIIRDSLVYDQKNVTIIEIMGRNVGWLTGAAALAGGMDCDGPDLVYLPEMDFNLEEFIKKVEELQKTKKALVVAVSEGIRLSDGKYVCELVGDVKYTDQFGHTLLSGSGKYLSNKISTELGCKSRGIELNTLQRCASHMASLIDITEAYQVGAAAVNAALDGKTGEMIVINRISNQPYQCTNGTYDIHKIANMEKKVPLNWIKEDNTGMSEEFMDYVKPLIQEELTPIMIGGLPKHINYNKY